MTRPDGPLDATQFTRESAERIGRVVRAAEEAVPPASPLSFAPWFGERMPRSVRAAKFSGAWPIGASKVVSFSLAPTGTVTVQNLSWPLASPSYSNEDCLVGREGTSWWLIVPVLQTATAVFVTQTATARMVTQTATARFVTSSVSQSVVTGVSTTKGTVNYLSDVSVSASLSTADCSISVSVTKTTGSAEVITGVDVTTGTVAAVGSFGTATVVAGSISGTYIVQSSTATYLKIRGS